MFKVIKKWFYETFILTEPGQFAFTIIKDECHCTLLETIEERDLPCGVAYVQRCLNCGQVHGQVVTPDLPKPN